MRKLHGGISRLLIVFLVLNLFIPSFVHANSPKVEANKGKVSNELLELFDSDDEQITFLVKFKDKANTLLVAEKAKAVATKQKLSIKKQEIEQRSAVISELKSTSISSQEEVLRFLKAQKENGKVSDVKPYYIVNAIAITATKEIAKKLATFPEVEKILPNEHRKLNQVTITPTSGAVTDSADTEIEWNVSRVGAPKAWDMGLDGTGTVVAIIDSGVDWKHPALKEKYRGNQAGTGEVNHIYSWYDATSNNLSEPYDDLGHGTHVTGTIVGSEPNGTNHIGIAPGAKWIAVKAFTQNTGTDADLLEAAEWILAPGGNVEMAPDVVNNSWSGGAGIDEWYLEVVKSWRAAGIFPVFSAGNTDAFNSGGPGSISNPANYPISFAIGAVDSNNMVADFSLRGPSPYGEVKPDISAPGVNIRSSVPGGRYEAGWNGTSMAGPAVTGVVALLRQADAKLSVEDIGDILIQTAIPITDTNYADTPNNGYGYGLINAYTAVKTVVNGHGRITGTVMATSPSIPLHATVKVLETGRSVETNPETGEFSLIHQPGEWTVQAEANGYQIEELKINVSSSGVSEVRFDLQELFLGGIERIYGYSRYETAIEISQSSWNNAKTVVLTRGNEFADALAGVPLAVKLDAPILLTHSDQLLSGTLKEINRLGADKVIVLGGELAVSKEVIAELESNGLQVRRISGKNRFATAGKIASEVSGNGSDKIVVANGVNFPDALSVASYAAREGLPILLTRSEYIPDDTRQAIEQLGSIGSIVVGGTSVVSDRVMADLPFPVRISGHDRYDTNIALAKYFGINNNRAYIATGKQYADALTGAALAARGDSGILLVHTIVPTSVEDYLNGSIIKELKILGGEVAVGSTVVDRLQELLQ